MAHAIQLRRARATESAAPAAEPAAKAPNRAGLPKWIQAGVERLSGLAMDDVRVHRDSAEPAKLGALAFTKGSDIHLGPGQEQHLPHEAWHVVQQKQGRVMATTRVDNLRVNEDSGLEAEATAMGTAALASQAGHALRERAPTATDVIQRQVGETGAQTAAPESQEKAAAAQETAVAEQAASQETLSGSAWWNANQGNYPNSNSTDDLASPFRENVVRFIDAMTAAGITVNISSTKRNATRAKLMHYSWNVAKGLMKASDVPAIPDCQIVWDHGDDTSSKQGAQQMVDLFGIVHQPSLTSNHIEGNAIDMSLSWTGSIQVTDSSGTVRTIAAPQSGANSILQEVGATYSVLKLASDPPHWSSTGN